MAHNMSKWIIFLEFWENISNSGVSLPFLSNVSQLKLCQVTLWTCSSIMNSKLWWISQVTLCHYSPTYLLILVFYVNMSSHMSTCATLTELEHNAITWPEFVVYHSSRICQRAIYFKLTNSLKNDLCEHFISSARRLIPPHRPTAGRTCCMYSKVS